MTASGCGSMASSGCGSMSSSGSASISGSDSARSGSMSGSGFCTAAAAALSAILLSSAAFWLTSSSIRLSIAASVCAFSSAAVSFTAWSSSLISLSPAVISFNSSANSCCFKTSSLTESSIMFCCFPANCSNPASMLSFNCKRLSTTRSLEFISASAFSLLLVMVTLAIAFCAVMISSPGSLVLRSTASSCSEIFLSIRSDAFSPRSILSYSSFACSPLLCISFNKAAMNT